MINSIQHFCENGVKRLTNVFKTYTDDLTRIAEMVYGVTDEVTRLGCSMIAEEWESFEGKKGSASGLVHRPKG